MNNTRGTSSTAAKFASAFSLGSAILKDDKAYTDLLQAKAFSSYDFSKRKLGVTQTVSVRSPYIYAEDNWVDDMELAAVSLYKIRSKELIKPDPTITTDSFLKTAMDYASIEKITPWLGADTAKHYQWYPFINLGHYELAKQLKDKRRDTIIGYYKQGIRRVWDKANQNAFYRGIPFIWCSNNLTTSFAIQCYWYRQLSDDKSFLPLEQDLSSLN